jgi:hypothetical protein
MTKRYETLFLQATFLGGPPLGLWTKLAGTLQLPWPIVNTLLRTLAPNISANLGRYAGRDPFDLPGPPF